MGGMNMGGGSSAKGKKKGLRRPKRRIAINIDMTPMVDIAFLLLIFYMVATVFAQPQAMEINLPPAKDEIETKQSKVLTIRVDGDDNMWWNTGDDDPQEIDANELTALLQTKVSEIEGLITLVKINKGARYARMVKILDAIEIVEHRFKQSPQWPEDYSYTFSLGPWSRLDTKIIERVAPVQDSVMVEGAANP